MTSYFTDKSFIVTGASSGIGRAIAETLAERGARVAIMARRRDLLSEVARPFGEQVLSCPGDVTSKEDCEAVVGTAVKSFGGLDGLIHNAGVTMRAVAIDTEMDVYRRLMEINFFSMVGLYQLSMPHLTRSNGHLVAVSSLMGRFSTQLRSGYTASKHALQGFMDSVRLEVTQDGVHVMVVSPGFVRTEGSVSALTADGTLYGKVDDAMAAGLAPEAVAQEILTAIEKRKRDCFPTGPRERFGFWLSRHAPSALDRLLLRSEVK